MYQVETTCGPALIYLGNIRVILADPQYAAHSVYLDGCFTTLPVSPEEAKRLGAAWASWVDGAKGRTFNRQWFATKEEADAYIAANPA